MEGAVIDDIYVLFLYLYVCHNSAITLVVQTVDLNGVGFVINGIPPYTTL